MSDFMPVQQEKDSPTCTGFRSQEPTDICDFLRVRNPWQYESLPMGYVSLDRTGKIMELNRMAARILGFSENELTGRDFFTLLNPEDLKIMEKSGYRLQDMEAASQINLRIQNVCGRTWIKVFVMNTDVSDRDSLSLIFSDITNQKQTEKELGWQLRVTREMDAVTDAITDPEPDYNHISRIVLNAAADLTQSANGFIAGILKTSHGKVELGFEQIYPQKCELTSSTMTLSPDGRDGFASSLGRAIKTGKPFFTTQPPKESTARRLPEDHIPIHGALVFPMLFNHPPRKLLVLANPAAPYSQEMVKMITRLAKLYSIALKLERSG